MPRRSLESLTIAPAPVPQVYPEAPPAFTKRQAELWKTIVLSRPGDYFDATGRLLLAALCVHVESFETVTREMEREAQSEEASDVRMKLLTQMRAAEGAAMASLATRLRLTPQSRYTPLTARSAAREGAHAAELKPWLQEPQQRKARPKAPASDSSAA